MAVTINNKFIELSLLCICNFSIFSIFFKYHIFLRYVGNIKTHILTIILIKNIKNYEQLSIQ